jgi:hypothetical protein
MMHLNSTPRTNRSGPGCADENVLQEYNCNAILNGKEVCPLGEDEDHSDP